MGPPSLERHPACPHKQIFLALKHTMPKIHRALGLSVTYPDNWSLTEDVQDDQVVGFQIQSPATAFLSVIGFDPSTSPEQAIEQVTQLISVDYDNVESENFSPQEASHPGIPADSIGREMYFYYLDMLVHTELIALGLPNQTILVQFQAEDSEYRSLERVYAAMLMTLCESIESTQEGLAGEPD